MNVTVPDSLKDFVEKQTAAGRFATADAYVEDLLQAEADLWERVHRGEALPVDEHFARRVEVLLDEGEQSGDYADASPEAFDAMEREALDVLRKRAR